MIPQDLRYSSDHEWIRTLDSDADTQNTGGTPIAQASPTPTDVRSTSVAG